MHLSDDGRIGVGGRPPRCGSGERGVALVELALVLPFLAVIVFGTIDLGRVFRLQNRLINAAREGGAVAQFYPRSVDSGCDAGRNVVDRVAAEEADLAGLPGYRVTVFTKEPGTGRLVPTDGYRGCGPTSSFAPLPGDRVVVQVAAWFTPVTPLVSALTGSPITVVGRQEVVVQG